MPATSLKIHARIEKAALEAREQRAATGYVAAELEPGDVTHYEVSVVPYGTRNVRVGFGAGFERGGFAVLPTDYFLHWSYVQSKLGLDNEHSARVLADFLNALFGHTEGA